MTKQHRTGFMVLPLTPKVKERPRFSLHAYMSRPYKDWMAKAKLEMQRQWSQGLWRNVSLRIELHGPERGDLDNLAGSVMDAAKGIVYPDDSVRYVQELNVKWVRATKGNHQILVFINAEMP